MEINEIVLFNRLFITLKTLKTEKKNQHLFF